MLPLLPHRACRALVSFVAAAALHGPDFLTCRTRRATREILVIDAITKISDKADQPAGKTDCEQAAEDARLSGRQVRQVSVAKITQAGYRHAAAWCALSKPHRAQIGGISGGICENRRGQNLAKSIR